MKHARILALLIVISLPGSAIADTFPNVTIQSGGPILQFDDTLSSDADWRVCVDITSGCSTDQDFAVRWDDTSPVGNGTPFLIENGTGNNLLYLDSTNRIGINTSAPGYTVDAVGSGIRLLSGGKQILTRTTGTDVDLEAIGASLFMRSSTAGKNIIMNPYGTDGNVGIGTTAPTAQLHVGSADGKSAKVIVQNTTAPTAAGDVRMLELTNAAASNKIVRFSITAQGKEWTFDNDPVANMFRISRVGTGVAEFTVDASGTGRFVGNSYAVNHVNTSSRAVKAGFAPVDGKAVLEKVAALPITTWHYRTEVPEATHMGPVAEDFQALFGLSDGQHISTVDTSGVAFAAIQGLRQTLAERNQALEEQLQAVNRQLSEKDRQIQGLMERLTALETLVQGTKNVAMAY
jgi:hypothetical protein